MNIPLHILHLEDDPADIRLVADSLHDGGLDAMITVATNQPEFLEAMEQGGFDVLLADFRLPAFDGLQALALWRARWPDIPFVFVTGSMGEELAVESLRRGATDYILKENLTRLIPAIRRGVAEAEERLQRRRAESELRESHARLEVAIQELEAFAYTVSHDLRSPLRSINAFAKILQDDYAASLKEDALHCLEMIKESSLQMEQLIDDLLAFSRLSGRPLEKEPVNIEMLVRAVLEDLHAERADRPINIAVGKLPHADADSRLLRQVWANLLSNALKFTRGRAPAVINIGHEIRDGKTVYFVQDNGTGFDMRFASKLFGLFQRMHRTEDFEGTGVGLAIAQRIIARHGGRIWAEATKNRGATFYFTLGQQSAGQAFGDGAASAVMPERLSALRAVSLSESRRPSV